MPTNEEVTDRIIEVLASIRAVEDTGLRDEIEVNGADMCELTSHEVVAVLVELEPLTGLDPEDPDVLKGCNAQSLADLVDRCQQKEAD